MTAISKRIPNLLLGVSQQPDIRKIPGQVRSLNNAYPEYALGLLKRPGGQHIASLVNATTSGRWFNILLNDVEKYVGQYDDNLFRIWLQADGRPRRVDMQTANGQEVACNQTDYETQLNAFNAAVATTKSTLDTLNAAEIDYAKKKAGQTATFVELLEFTYTYNSADGERLEDIKSGAKVNKEGSWIYLDNGVLQGDNTSTLPTGYTLGKEVTLEHLMLASEGYKIYALTKEIAAAHTPSELTAATTALNNARNAYVNAVAAEAAALTNLNNELSDCECVPASGDYLFGATADDLEFLTISDYTLVLNKAKTVAMDPAQSAASQAGKEAFVRINGAYYNTVYQITINGTTVSFNSPTEVQTDGSDPLDAVDIATQLKAALDAASPLDWDGTAGNTSEVIGSGIFISSNSSFTISVGGGLTSTAITVFQDKVKTQGELPSQCKNNYLVKIINATDLTADDMYVKFETTDNASSGPGTWVETLAPGLTYRLDPKTMPHKLERLSDGSFKFSQITWDERKVGDDDSAPLPAFVDSTISNMVFYRNRLAFISDDSVVMSRNGDVFNFFATSAVQAVDDDPIELTASTTKAASLRYAQAVQAGLVIFGDRQQFLLSTDGDILSPKTAKINSLSSYECDPNVPSVELGSSSVFVAKTPLYTRVYEFTTFSATETPQYQELTVAVPEFLPKDIDLLITSSTQSIIAAGTSGKSKIFFYKFIKQGEKAVNTWFTWDLTGTLLFHWFDESAYFAVVKHGTEVFINKFDLSQANNDGSVTLSTGERTDVCLDHWFTKEDVVYNSSSEISTFTLPYTHIDSNTYKLAIVDVDDGIVEYPTVSSGSTTFTIEGDWRGKNLVLGYVYDMDIELPKFYVTEESAGAVLSDFTADIIIHRVKVSLGMTGPVKYKVKITGIPENTEIAAIAMPYQYETDSINIAPSAVQEVPIYQRNENIKFTITADTPFPCSILALQWEGRLGTNFYQRS